MDYYSAQPFLAWCFNHYFFAGRHFIYVAAPFHTFKGPNPTSSNPWRRYGDLYEPWWDRDRYSAHIRASRLGLEQGAIAHRRAGTISWPLSLALIAIAQGASERMFYPVVYWIDLNQIDERRREKEGSGAATESDEWLIRDLEDDEFMVLFFDPQTDDRANNPTTLMLGRPLLGGSSISASLALQTLRAEIRP